MSAPRTPTEALEPNEADAVREILEHHDIDEAQRLLGVCEVTALRLMIRGRKLHRASVQLVRERLRQYAPRTL